MAASCALQASTKLRLSRESSRSAKTRQVRRAVIKNSQELLGTGAVWLAKTHCAPQPAPTPS